MRLLKKEGSKQQKKNVEMCQTLSRSELNFIRGGDEGNTEKGDGNQ